MAGAIVEITPVQEAKAILRFIREGNEFVRMESLIRVMSENDLKPEEIGSTKEELRALFIADCKFVIRRDLAHWRTSYGIRSPGEKCFAEGVVDSLKVGKLDYAEFGISDIEMRYIKQAAGLR